MRSDAREAAFKIVFSELFSGPSEKGFRSSLYRGAKLNEEDKAYAEEVVRLVSDNLNELSDTISAQVKRFADYRIYAADRAVMLVALAEIRYFDDIPPVVSVSEAARIARKYSTERSADFVNGVLGGIIEP